MMIPFSRCKKPLIVLICCLSLYIVFYKLGASPLENWDEAWYGDVVRNIVKTKEYFILYWNKEIFLDKPPLYMWLSSLSVYLFGLSEFSIRFVSALSGFITILIIFFYSYRTQGLIPSLTAFSTLAFNNIYIWRVRSGNLDSSLTLLFVISYFLIITKSKFKYELLGLIFALIYLTKLTVFLFPFAIFVAVELIFERKNWKKNIKGYLKVVLITFTIIFLWLTIGTLKTSSTFYRYFLFQGDQGVSQISFNKFNLNYFFHSYFSLQRRFFWLFLIGLFFSFFHLKKKKYFAEILFSLCLIIYLSFTERNNNWYLLPSMPFWSLICATGIKFLLDFFFKYKKVNVLFILGYIFLASYISLKTFLVNIRPIINTTGPVNLKISSLKIRELSSKDDIVVRLDQLYPTTIFYTERKVYVSLEGNPTKGFVMSYDDLFRKIKNKKVKWIVGVNSDIEKMITKMPKVNYQLIKTSNEEKIIHLL